LAHPDVEALIVAAISKAPAPLPAKGRGKLVIQKGGAKKRAKQKPEVSRRASSTRNRPETGS
jgi:hypothetical protein